MSSAPFSGRQKGCSATIWTSGPPTLDEGRPHRRADRSESGQSFGEITVASGLDTVETAILAAALETIEQVGPCRAEIEVSEIEDVRSAKRREVVERATELLNDFEEKSIQTADIVETVRQRSESPM